MVKNIILNYALINEDSKYRVADHCTTYADSDINIIQFETLESRQKYIVDNGISIETMDRI